MKDGAGEKLNVTLHCVSVGFPSVAGVHRKKPLPPAKSPCQGRLSLPILEVLLQRSPSSFFSAALPLFVNAGLTL